MATPGCLPRGSGWGAGDAPPGLPGGRERRFRDFRGDNTLDTRQFQVALKHLRQYSGLVDLPPTEFDVDNTIQDTAEHGGMLTVRYKKPRQNTVKVLLMMDSGGSMDYYAQLCSALFQAVSKVGHFKDLKVYYFHNCPMAGSIRTQPAPLPGSVQTEWLLSNLSSEYKVIFVGDAQMAPYELTGGWYYGRDRDPSLPRCGMDWVSGSGTSIPISSGSTPASGPPGASTGVRPMTPSPGCSPCSP